MIRRVVFVGLSSLLLTTSALPATAVPVGPIVDTCSPVEESEEIDLACATAVDGFISAYEAAPDKAEALGDLAYNLASLPLVEPPLCKRIAREVDKIGQATPDAQQAETLAGISLTVLECRPSDVAAVRPIAASGNGPNV